MKIKKKPIFSFSHNSEFNIDAQNELVEVFLNGTTEVFDFSAFQEDGELEVIPDIIEEDVSVFGKIKRENGELYVECLDFTNDVDVCNSFVDEWEVV